MKLTLQALQILDAVARTGSFAGAAAELGRVPSALSYQIRAIEQVVDVLIFDRRRHRAKLTPAGAELLREGRCLLDAAASLQQRVQKIASGWEAEIRIAIDALVPLHLLQPLLVRLYAACAVQTSSRSAVPADHEIAGRPPAERVPVTTRVRLSSETLRGCWQAVAAGRADIAVGVVGEAPAGRIYRQRRLGGIAELFVLAPTHPLAACAEPINTSTVAAHRAIALADSARDLPSRTLGLDENQDRLIVPDLASKLNALIAGLGAGWLPEYLARPALAQGALVARQLEDPKPRSLHSLVWQEARPGRALRWWIDALSDAQAWAPGVFSEP